MKRRILFLRRPPFVGGAELRMIDWLGAIDYSKNEVLLSCPSGDPMSQRVRSLGLPVKYVPQTVPVKGSFFRVFFGWLMFLKRLRPNKIIMGDAVVSEWRLATVLAASLVTRGNVYMSEHAMYPNPPAKSSRLHFGFLPGLGIWWYRLVLPLRARALLSRRVIAISEDMKKWLVRYYGYPPKKVSVVYHGVDPSRFCPPDASARTSVRLSLGLPPEATVIVSTARLSPEKRLDRLIKAFDVLAKDRPDLWLLLAGEGGEGTVLQALASAGQASARIKFLGFLEDITPVFRAGDIFVLPTECEAFGSSVLEAMATGLVAVATNCGGPPEVIQDNFNGFLVDVSYEGVLVGMEKALNLSAVERLAMGRKARQRIMEGFRLEDGLERFRVAIDIAPDGKA